MIGGTIAASESDTERKDCSKTYSWTDTMMAPSEEKRAYTEGTHNRRPEPEKRQDVSDDVFPRISFGSIQMFQDVLLELKCVTAKTSISSLLCDEIERLRQKRRLMFPETTSIWDIFWIGGLLICALALLPGFYVYLVKKLPASRPYWTLAGEVIYFKETTKSMEVYHTPHLGLKTPLQTPMPNYFIIHVFSGSVTCFLMILMFTTGRVLRWRLADGTIDFDSSENLHKFLAFWISLFWVSIVVSGFLAIPNLHPTLQVINYLEWFGVTFLVVGTLMSAYYRQWVFHRLCAWGLVYSCVATLFLLVNGRFLQAFTDLPCFYIKMSNYILAFCVPIVGLTRDILLELSKVKKRNEAVNLIDQFSWKEGMKLRRESLEFGMVPFKAARGDKLRKLSLFIHIMQAESHEDYLKRRSSVVGGQIDMLNKVQNDPECRRMYEAKEE